MSREIEEALAAADRYAEVGLYGADAGHLRALAERVRELEAEGSKKAKKKDADTR